MFQRLSRFLSINVPNVFMFGNNEAAFRQSSGCNRLGQSEIQKVENSISRNVQLFFTGINYGRTGESFAQ